MTSTPASRLRQARQKSGFKSARIAATENCWTISTYTSHENGIRGYDLDSAQDYARVFGVSAAWLLTGELSLPHSNQSMSQPEILQKPHFSKIETVDVPLISYTQLMTYSQGELGIEDIRAERVFMSFIPKEKMTSSVVSLRVGDDSNAPSLKKNDLVVIDLMQRPVSGKRCVAMLKNFETPVIGRYEERERADLVQKSLSFDHGDIADMILDDDQILALYAVIAVVIFD